MDVQLAVDADDDEQLAWLLLQASGRLLPHVCSQTLCNNSRSSGFLDIDKAIEYRKQPDEKASRQTAIPQRKSTASHNDIHFLAGADARWGISRR